MQAPSLSFHHPIPRLTLLFFSGLWIGSLVEPWIGRFFSLLPLITLLLLIRPLLYSWSPALTHLNARRFCTLALILFTIWRGVEPYHQHREQESWIARHLVELESPVTLSGIVKERGVTRRGRGWIELDVDGVFLEGEQTRGRGRIRLYTKEVGSTIDAFESGDRLSTVVHRIRQSRQRAPGTFDPHAWRVREGFHAEGTLLDVISVEKSVTTHWKRPVERVASRIRGHLDQMPLDEPMKSVLRAMLTGDRSGLDPGTDEQLARAGVSHVMAVSGLHVGLVLAPFWWLFMNVRSHWSGCVIWMVTGLMLLLYVEIADQSPSVSRAAIMSWMAGWFLIPMRRLPTPQLLMMAGMILLLWKPVWLRHPGFQLSMVAVWSILILHAPVERKLRNILSMGPLRNALSMVLLTAILQIALAPLLLWWFGEISVVAPLANLLVVPLVPLLTVTGWSWVFLNHLSLDGGVLIDLVQWVLTWILYWTEWFARLSWATVTPGWWFWWALIPVLVLSAQGYSWVRDSRKRTLLWYTMTVLVLSASLVRNMQSGKLVVTILDVGQGDAIHIETPNGYHMLVDTGSAQAASQVVVPYLKAAGVNRIDALLLTHPHADHAGGTRTVVSEISIGSLVHVTRFGGDVRADLPDTKRIPIRKSRRGERLKLDPAVRLYLLDSRVVNPTENNDSAVIKLVYGKTSILFTGDAERRQELDLVRTYGTWLGADVLKAGHHGSRTSSQRLFLQYVDPSWSVISAGWMNRYDHPHRETLERLHRQGSNVQITAESGSVRMVSNGSRMSPVRWN